MRITRRTKPKGKRVGARFSINYTTNAKYNEIRLAIEMKNNKKFIFSLILVCFAIIGIHQIWQNIITDGITIIAIVITIVVVIKDLIGGMRRK